MPLLGNPLGLLALAAIPAILAIHFLQRESRHVVVSTLFLLHHLSPESAAGRRFQRLRSSLPLWLQLLAALITTWLLIQPRWIRSHATQHIVIVLDSTVSMRAFSDEMFRQLDQETQRLAGVAAQTDWQLLESDATQPTLYTGSSRSAMLEALKSWKPRLGTHDPSPQLEAARNLLRGNGLLIFVSDRPRALPLGVHLLAVGHPFAHCGFVGLSVDDSNWRALIKNDSDSEQRRNWWIESAGQKSTAQVLVLPPGGTVELHGEFSPGVSRCELVMDDADAFPLNSRLPMVRPRLKQLELRVDSSIPEFDRFFSQLEQSLDRVITSGAQHALDLELQTYDPTAPRWPPVPAIVFFTDPAPVASFPSGSIAAAPDSLASDLNWSGLLVRGGAGIPLKPDDETLVWQGNLPLLFLRHDGSKSFLVVNFDLRTSNASKLPAFILLLHRFAEEIRAAKVAPESRNVETNEELAVAADARLPAPLLAGAPDARRAPADPGFFRVTQNSAELLDGAAHFADPRAADFRPATTVNDVRGAEIRAAEENSEADLFAPVWMLLLGMAIGGSWVAQRA